MALVSSFLKAEKVPEKRSVVPRRLLPPQEVAKVGSKQIVREVPKKAENGNGGVNDSGISCAHCNKVFSRALIMLDFRDGKNRLVSVCPYCNHVLRNTSDVESTKEIFHVEALGEKIMR
jgi:phage FluMu protein Com